MSQLLSEALVKGEDSKNKNWHYGNGAQNHREQKSFQYLKE